MGRRKVNSLVTRANRRRQEAFDKLLWAARKAASTLVWVAETELRNDPNRHTLNDDIRTLRDAIAFAEETLRTRLIDETFERR